MEGHHSSEARGYSNAYLPNSNTAAEVGGGTYTSANRTPSIADYEAVFGPSARDIKMDNGRFKRHQRWHLPDVLKGPNEYLTDRIDGLISDTTNSPFTTALLPYTYLDRPDQKIKWNVWSFDEGTPTPDRTPQTLHRAHQRLKRGRCRNVDQGAL
jgi:hypothetical protein